MTATGGPALMEGPRLSATQLARLLPWDGMDEPLRVAAYATMHRVLYGVPARLPPSEINRAMAQILDLVPAFCRHCGLGARERAQLDTWVRARLAWRLTEIAGVYSDAEFAEARNLLANGPMNPWLRLLTRRPARRVFVSLHGPRLVRAMQQRRSP